MEPYSVGSDPPGAPISPSPDGALLVPTSNRHTPQVTGQVTRCLKAWHERGDFLGDIAVICMNTDHGKRIAHQLQSLGIPHLQMANRTAKRAYDPRKPEVNILSVQSSKGLEFRSVIFIGLGQIDSSETQAAQNMKLLYVGMTRAKERLMITASGKNEFTEKLGSVTGMVCAVA
ncbi:MAG: 3'-5' exonuclease [Luteolibacter sp.]